jgi:hypothetical protein
MNVGQLVEREFAAETDMLEENLPPVPIFHHIFHIN